MMITQEVLDSLRTTFSGIYDAAYEGTPVWYDKVATVVPSAAKNNTYGWAAHQIRMREWIGPRVAQNLAEHKYVLENKPFEATIELDRDDIEDDNLGIFASIAVPGLAEASRKHPDALVTQVLQANPNGFDGVPFFDDAHPNFNTTGVGPTAYSNDFSFDLDGDGFEAVWAAMASYVGENGHPLSVNPRLLIVPPQLYRKALTIMSSTTYAVPNPQSATAAVSVDNVMRGWAEPLMIPELANEPNVWYLADVSKTIKPFIHQLRRPAQLVARDNPADPRVFENKKFVYGVDSRENVGVTLPFLIARSTIPGSE